MVILPQRPLRGSRISTFYPVKNLPSLASLDSAFQLQEYISLLIRLDVHDVEAITTLPGKRAGKEKGVDIEGNKDDVKDDGEDGDEKGKNEPTVDEACWIYEQLRRLAQDLTHPLITMLQQECTRASCPEMKAGEWLYLCVAHGTDGNVEQCCAIDYILHTLDSATALLNTPRAFPSRIQIPQSSHRHFSSLARRLGRIFAHAYFHHREAFEQAEAESSLYARFLALTSKFDLVPSEFLVIPTPLSMDSDSDRENEVHHDTPAPRLLPTAVDPHMVGEAQWSQRSNVIPVETRTKSASPPRLNNGHGSESPRKLGRSRTDTMVLHDAYAVAEELAKASPKVPPFEVMEEPMSPMDVEELPHAVKPPVECLEEIGQSLPESPILHSPPPPVALLPAPVQEGQVPQEVSPTSTVAEHPVITPKAEPTTTEESASVPVEADIAETALASITVQTTPLVAECKEAVEDTPTETEKEANEAQPPKEVAAEEVEEVAQAEVAEFVAVLTPATKQDLPSEMLDLPAEATAPAPDPEPTVDVAAEPENSTPASTHAGEESTDAPVETPQSQRVVCITDEIEVVIEKKEEPIESAPGMESAAEAKTEEKKAEAADTPVTAPSPATEFNHAPSLSS